MAIAEQIREVRERIARACARVGRDPASVRIIAVSKYIETEKAREWVDAGLTDLGENRWVVAKPKIESLGSRVTWHFIGHLQTNKVKPVTRFFQWLHSLDRPALAEALAKRLQEDEEEYPHPLYTLVQVNIAEEATKGGIRVQEVKDFLDYIYDLRKTPRWKVAGWMTMAPIANRAEEVRWVFRALRELRDRWADHPVWEEGRLPELSMGMSDDYEVAVEEGATMVRLGRALLGDSGVNPAVASKQQGKV